MRASVVLYIPHQFWLTLADMLQGFRPELVVAIDPIKRNVCLLDVVAELLVLCRFAVISATHNPQPEQIFCPVFQYDCSCL